VGIKSTLLNIYDKQYKKLLIITIILLVLAIGILCYQYSITGEFVQKGVSLKGGITVTIPITKEVDIHKLQSDLNSMIARGDIGVRSVTEAGRIKAIKLQM
jgi:preprotein translocase subunit SecF